MYRIILACKNRGAFVEGRGQNLKRERGRLGIPEIARYLMVRDAHTFLGECKWTSIAVQISKLAPKDQMLQYISTRKTRADEEFVSTVLTDMRRLFVLYVATTAVIIEHGNIFVENEQLELWTKGPQRNRQQMGRDA